MQNVGIIQYHHAMIVAIPSNHAKDNSRKQNICPISQSQNDANNKEPSPNLTLEAMLCMSSLKIT